MCLSLFDLPVDDDRALSLRERFARFHADNPEVYRLLVRFARELKAHGRGSYGIAALFERVRWHYAVERDDAEEFKLNNSYRAFYARLLMAQEPDLAGFFETRVQRTEDE